MKKEKKTRIGQTILRRAEAWFMTLILVLSVAVIPGGTVIAGEGDPGNDHNISGVIAIKKQDAITYLLNEDENADEQINEAYLLKRGTDGKCTFQNPDAERTIEGIGLLNDNGRYKLILDDFTDAAAELVLSGSGIAIGSSGTNAARSIKLGDSANLEISPADGISDGTEEGGVASFQEDRPQTTITLSNGIYAAEDTMAQKFALRDDVKVIIGSESDPVTDAYRNIQTVELYNYEFHKHGKYSNNEIYATNAFTNVKVVELYYSYLSVAAVNLFAGQVDTSKGAIEIFQEAQLTMNSDITIPEGALVTDRYYDHYPDNDQPYEGQTKNAGILAFDATDAEGEHYIQTYDLTEHLHETTDSGEYHYSLTTDDKTTTITSADPIIYSVMYNVDDDGDGSKELSYRVDDGNGGTTEKHVTLENGNCGQVEMKGFEKGYYIKDGSNGKFEAWIAAGEKVDVILMPDAGYQYAANTLNVNGEVITDVTPSDDADAVGRYSFTMNKCAGHISAGFAKTEDVVSFGNNMGIENAQIELGEASIKNGNAKLNIDHYDGNPVEDSKLVESVAGDYEMQFMDISLSEYVVKNYDPDAEEQSAWETKQTKLSDPVRITIEMEGTGDTLSEYSVVRLHKEEGEETEATELQTIYDSALNTISFSTDRFSTYAIVKKTLSIPWTQTGLDYSAPTSGTVQLEGTVVTIDQAVISEELCLYGPEYGVTPMTLVVKGTNTVEYLIFDTAVTVICQEGATLTFGSGSNLKGEFETGSYTLGANTALEGSVFRYVAPASQNNAGTDPGTNPTTGTTQQASQTPSSDIQPAAQTPSSNTQTTTDNSTETSTKKASLSLNDSKLVVKKGQTVKTIKVSVENDSVGSVKSSNIKIATVGIKGNVLTVKGIKKGSAKITVTTKSGLTAVLAVTVQNDKVVTKTLKVSKSSVTLKKKGKTVTVTATATPDVNSTGQKITATSSNKKIATVKVDASTGKITITAKKKGSCTITVKAGSKKKTIKVKVKK